MRSGEISELSSNVPRSCKMQNVSLVIAVRGQTVTELVTLPLAEDQGDIPRTCLRPRVAAYFSFFDACCLSVLGGGFAFVLDFLKTQPSSHSKSTLAHMLLFYPSYWVNCSPLLFFSHNLFF